jgi:outer membrane protein
MKAQLWIFIALLVTGWGAATHARPEDAPPALKFTLAEAERFAMKNHPRIQATALTADAVREQIREARSAFFPQIYGEVSSVYAPYDEKTNAETRASALGGLNNPTIFSRQSDGIVVNQLLFDFGRTYDLTESARFQANAATERLTAMQELIVLEVDRAYYNLLQAHAVEQVAEETLKTRRTAFDQVSVLVKNQLRSTLDQSFDEVAVSQAELQLISARSEVREGEAVLSTALGFADCQHFALQEEPLKLDLPEAPDAFISAALRQRPDLAALREESQAASRFAEAQNAAQYPKVSATAAAGINPVADDKLLNHNYYAAGVNVEIPLATGGNLNARADEAQLLKRAADANIIDTQNAIARDVQVAWLTLGTDKERIRVTGDLVRSAAQAVKLADARYRLGTSSIVEFNDAQLNYTGAQVEAARARYEFQNDHALLDFATGARH